MEPDEKAAKESLQRAFGNAVKARRKHELGLTQEELAHDKKLNTAWISHIENGNNALNLWNLQRIAKALGITMSELLVRTERQEREERERHNRQ